MSTVTTFLNLVKPASPEQFSLATINNNYDLIDAHLKNTVDKMAKGLVFQNKVFATSGAIGTTQTVILNIPSFAFKAGRKYKIHWYFEYAGGVAGNYVDTSINTCATTDTGTAITGLAKYGGASHKIHDALLGNKGEAIAYFNPASDTTLQVKFVANVYNGSGTMTFQASASQPTVYSIVDEGAQF